MPTITANILKGKYEDVLAAVQSPVIALTELIKNASDSCNDISEPIVIKIDTIHRTITIIDRGNGLSKNDLDRLGEAGFSEKMIGSNTHSPINNPLSGSKGLGLLTAFFIAETLEIETYSTRDGKSYFLTWQKGTQEYHYDEVTSDFVGTTITLKDVGLDKLQMILLPEEKVKLFMASLRFFTSDNNLPKIKLIIDGVEEDYYPSETLDSFYLKSKGRSSGFIAKASFRYEDNKIYLTYEDNVSNYYTFTDQVIDLTNLGSVDEFIKAIHALDKGPAPIRSICESDVFHEPYLQIKIPPFSGVMYTWRHRKSDDLEQWPVGVRIYINNYSMYRYLDKENDWLNLSEVSQNVKATNYKLKNTYGYLDFTNFNENLEELKISKERDDFVDSMAKRKFLHIMRDIIVSIFTRIDMTVKNPPVQSFSLRYSKVSVRLGQKFDLSNAVICNNIGMDDLDINFDDSSLSVDDDWNFSAVDPGEYEIKLSYGDISSILIVNFKKAIPEFSLTKQSIIVYHGNTVNLRDYISQGSCKDVSLESIEIVAGSPHTVIIGDLFDKNNAIDTHTILFRFGDFQKTLTITVKEIERQPGAGTKSPRIDILFPKLNQLRECSIKLPELIDAISSYYVQAPTLCMAAIRILLESSAKAFFESMGSDATNDSVESIINRIINMRDCEAKNNDYDCCVVKKGSSFVATFQKISSDYSTTLNKDAKKNINTHLKSIDLNMFVHNPNIIASDVTVYNSMQIFAPLLNFIFDVLLLMHQSKIS